MIHAFLSKKRIYFVIASFAVFWSTALQALSADLPKLKKMDKNGVVIEYLPALEPVAVKLHPWLCDYFNQHPMDMNKDFKRLSENQAKITQFLTQQLALDKPLNTLEVSMPEMLIKFRNIGNMIPNPHHIQLWHKKDLKTYLDGGGKIPGYQYTPGPDGENKLSLEKSFQTKEQDKVAPIDIQSPVFPLILKKDNPSEFLDEAKESLSKTLVSFPDVSTLMASTVFMPTVGMAVKQSMRSPMNLINWFSMGTTGYLTWQIFRDFISEDAAEKFLQTQDSKPFESIRDKINLVQWIGEEKPSEKPSEKESKSEAILLKARIAYSVKEMKDLVERHGADTIPKIFKKIRELAPFDPQKDSAPEKTESANGPEMVKEFDLLIQSIQQAVGEDFRARLLEYSQAALNAKKEAKPK